MKQLTLTEVEPDGEQCPTCGEPFDTQHGMRVHHAHVHGEELRDTLICEVCGSPFEGSPERTNQKYCTPECQNKGRKKRVELECEICGNPFETIPSVADNRVTCGSAECMSAWRSDQTGEDAFAYKTGKVELNCQICDDPFFVFPNSVERRSTCGDPDCVSERCSREFSGEDHPVWNGGKVEKDCPVCGDTYALYPADHEIYSTCRSDICTRIYQSRIMGGENHPNWKGGGSRQVLDVLRNALGTVPWKKMAETHREDNDTCELCGRAPLTDERSLSAHHIVPLRAGGASASELLMSVCDRCHPIIESFTWDIPEVESIFPHDT